MENKSGSETSKSTNIKHKQQNINTITIPSSDFDSSSDKTYFQAIKLYMNRIPLHVRFVTLLTIVLYLLSIFLENIMKCLVNIPEKTIIHIHLWTILSSTFINSRIYNLIYSLIIWIPEATSLENLNGTVRYVLNFIMNSIVIQLLFIGASYAFSPLHNEILTDANVGIMPVVLAEITILSMANPRTLVNFLCIPFYFPARFYPFIVYFFFTAINFFTLHVDVIVGLIYGCFYYKFLRGYFFLSDEFIVKLENLFLCLKRLSCFIEVSKIKQSIRYHSFKNNTSQSSIEMQTTPNLASPQKLNENSKKMFGHNNDQSVSKLSPTDRSSNENNSTGIKDGLSLGKISSSDLKIEVKK